MSKITAKLAAVSLITVLSFGLAGCSAGPTGDSAAPNTSKNGSTDEGTSDTGGHSTESNDERAFGASDDTVIKGILTALSKADRAEFQGTSLMIYFNEGSVGDPTAGIGCLAAETLLADDENAVMVYSDGQLDCAMR